MPRAINLRQIEMFKAVIEHGTVSRAAEVLWISQPAASKLLMNLEADTGLTLFERQKGRLTPTDLGLRLYDEIDRIFSGVRQVETAIETVRRENQGQLSIGVIPALADVFIQETTMRFLKDNAGVYCAIRPVASQWMSEAVRRRQMDVGIYSMRLGDPFIEAEPLLNHPLVCIMPHGHPLADAGVITPEMLHDQPFISFKQDSYVGQKVLDMFERHGVRANIVMTADANPTLRQFVAAGLGISLVHPLFAYGLQDKLTLRRFVPEIESELLFCYAREGRNGRLLSAFMETARLQARECLASLGF